MRSEDERRGYEPDTGARLYWTQSGRGSAGFVSQQAFAVSTWKKRPRHSEVSKKARDSLPVDCIANSVASIYRVWTVCPWSLRPKGLTFGHPCNRDEVVLPSEADNMDFEGEVAIVTDAVPMGTTAVAAAAHIKLLMLVNAISLRAQAAREMKTGFGWIQAKLSVLLDAETGG